MHKIIIFVVASANNIVNTVRYNFTAQVFSGE